MTERPSFSFSRRWNALVNVAISILAVVAIAVMVNYLGVRHFERMHWTAGMEFKLSPRTLQVLSILTNTVQVTVYYDADDDLYGRVTGLLKEYQSASPFVQVERVDYLRDVAAAKAVKAKYHLTQLSDKNLVIFDCDGRTRMVSSTELSDYDIKGALEQQSEEIRRTHFRGEMAFTSAIYSVATPRSLQAYFLTGHGEHDPTSTDQAMGYSKFADILKDECNIRWAKLSLLGNNDIPADSSLLIIPGPLYPFMEDELERIQRYLDQGGRLLALFNYYSVGKPTGLEKLLAQYEVAVGDNLVVDREHSPRGQLDLVPAELGSHPIVARLANSPVHLIRPRSVQQAKSAGARSGSARIEELLFTGPGTMIVSDFVNGLPRDSIPSEPVPLMVAQERGAVPGVTTDRGATRLVVIGDSFFLENDVIESAANRDFAAHTINWLVDQGVLLSGLAPRPIKTYSITMTEGQLVTAGWILLVVLPGAVLLLGGVVWWRRRS